MYLYLYDSFLNNKKYNTLLAKIETRLTDLGIGGKIARLSPLRNIKEMVEDEVRAGVKTIVVVGNDKTLNEAVNIAAKYDVVLGLIPVGQPNQAAQHLGIPEGEAACTTLSSRITKKIDLGKINDSYFLSGITIESGDVTLECEKQFTIRPQTKNAEIAICNFRPAFAAGPSGNYFNPEDGMLEIFIKPLSKTAGWFRKTASVSQSIIPFKKLSIDGRQSVSLITDSQKVIKSPVKIEIVPKKLKVIVGKTRDF